MSTKSKNKRCTLKHILAKAKNCGAIEIQYHKKSADKWVLLVTMFGKRFFRIIFHETGELVSLTPITVADRINDAPVTTMLVHYLPGRASLIPVH